ncbi:DoxX family protein [Streptomyces sp. NBC_01465]|uniref:DoxX family protein n=1 Tax=Streptomyces sp. NBC_01465 TaxID=2903878 RepID=UPI002E350D2D|nr:DoxX family protein [Streptomyces sp. NBC_01465]
MNTALWIVAGLLAVVFTTGSASKLFMSREKIIAFPGGSWAEDFGAGSIKSIGAVEFLAALGLVLPAALDIAPVLVPVAAVGVAVLMTGAALVRLRRHDLAIAVDLVYLALAVFVAWGRF